MEDASLVLAKYKLCVKKGMMRLTRLWNMAGTDVSSLCIDPSKFKLFFFNSFGTSAGCVLEY